MYIKKFPVTASGRNKLNGTHEKVKNTQVWVTIMVNAYSEPDLCSGLAQIPHNNCLRNYKFACLQFLIFLR